MVIVQKRVIRVLANADYRTHASPLFFKLSLLKLHDIYRLRIAELVFRYINHLLPESCANYFNPTPSTYSYNVRHTSYFKAIRYRTNVRFNCLNVQGPLIWDSLPADIRTACSLFVFKRLLTPFLLNNYVV